MHGGLSPDLLRPEDINHIPRPMEVPDEGLLCDIVWSDPDSECSTWQESERGVSYIFGANQVEDFLDRNDLDLICRAH